MNTLDFLSYNKSLKKSLLFRIGTNSGFFSEYNHMIFAIAYCIKNNIKFNLTSRYSNFGYKDGWNDYFIPFCDEYNNKIDNMFNYRYKVKPWNFLTYAYFYYHKIWRRINGIHFITSDIFNEIRQINPSDRISIKDLNLDCTHLELFEIINKSIYKYNKATLNEIKNKISNLHLPLEYVSIHIRRGDKITEVNNTITSKYINELENTTNIRHCFVATDDYSVILELELTYPEWTFYTLTSKENTGYNQNKFQQESKKSKRKDMISLFTDIEICSNSSVFVGTLSSNIGMYLYWRIPRQRFISVDYPEWQIW